MFIYNLLRIRTPKVDISNKRKWFYAKKARSRQYLSGTITTADYADDLVPLDDTPA